MNICQNRFTFRYYLDVLKIKQYHSRANTTFHAKDQWRSKVG